MNRKTIVHPSVVRIIRAVLVDHGVPRNELPVHTAEVGALVLEAIEGRHAPQRLGEWQKLAATRAAAYAVEACGKPPVASPRDPGITDDPDEQAPWLRRDPRDPARTPLQIAVMTDMFDHGEMPEGSRETLTLLADGETVEGIAGELDLTEDDVRGRLRLVRSRFLERLMLVETLASSVLDDLEDTEELGEFLAWLR